MRTRIVQLALAGAIFLPTGYGQIDSARIAGTVRDSTNSAVPYAAITVSNEKTGQERKVVADAVRYYVVSSLPPSTYTVAGQGMGLGPAEYSGIALTVG